MNGTTSSQKWRTLYGTKRAFSGWLVGSQKCQKCVDVVSLGVKQQGRIKHDKLMNRVMDHIVEDDPESSIRGWFFEVPLEDITRYNMLDFFVWCMFEGRNQEHLTIGEVRQLNWFVRGNWSVGLGFLCMGQGRKMEEGKGRGKATIIIMVIIMELRTAMGTINGEV